MALNRMLDDGRMFTCTDCGQLKKMISPRQETCKACMLKRRRRECLVCGRVWYVKTRYNYKPREAVVVQPCHTCKIEKKKQERLEELEVQLRPDKFYVYGWYKKKSNLPFYVGKGSGRRAWREEGRGSSVFIYRDGLTEDESFLIESVLIDIFTKLGANLENRQTGRN